MLELQGLHKSFGGFAAIAGVSLAVEERKVTAIIGPHGAGHSTLFNLVTGHLRPTSGRVLLGGRDVTGQAPYHLCRKGMGRSFQRANIFSRLTVFENVQAALLSHGERGWDLWSRRHELYRAETEEVLESVGLADKAEAPSASLSYGNQKQLELGIALASKPKLLEPVMKIEAVTEADYLGDVIGDINRRRGQVTDQGQKGPSAYIQGFVPLAEMFGLSALGASAAP